MTLGEFETELRSLIGKDLSLRPFVCEGSPLSCTAFVVGTNPATSFPFWPYWESGYGFRKGSWLHTYEDARFASGNRKRWSPTRNMIERIVAAAAPIKCLETNVFSKPSPSATDLRQGDRQTRIFEFLLKVIRPRVLHIHGKEVREYFEIAYGVQLAVERVTNIKMPSGTIPVKSTHHLAYQWSRERAKQMGQWLAIQSVA